MVTLLCFGARMALENTADTLLSQSFIFVWKWIKHVWSERQFEYVRTLCRQDLSLNSIRRKAYMLLCICVFSMLRGPFASSLMGFLFCFSFRISLLVGQVTFALMAAYHRCKLCVWQQLCPCRCFLFLYVPSFCLAVELYGGEILLGVLTWEYGTYCDALHYKRTGCYKASPMLCRRGSTFVCGAR